MMKLGTKTDTGITSRRKGELRELGDLPHPVSMPPEVRGAGRPVILTVDRSAEPSPAQRRPVGRPARRDTVVLLGRFSGTDRQGQGTDQQQYPPTLFQYKPCLPPEIFVLVGEFSRVLGFAGCPRRRRMCCRSPSTPARCATLTRPLARLFLSSHPSPRKNFREFEFA